jgi:hypothetical protein
MPEMMHEIEASSGDADLWLEPELDGLARGTGVVNDAEFERLVAEGGVDDPVPFRVAQPGRGGDLVWTKGSYIKVASVRFVEALRALGASGFKTFPITIEDVELTGRYVGLAVLPGDGDLRPVHDDGPFWSFRISARALTALTEAGAAEFRGV